MPKKTIENTADMAKAMAKFYGAAFKRPDQLVTAYYGFLSGVAGEGSAAPSSDRYEGAGAPPPQESPGIGFRVRVRREGSPRSRTLRLESASEKEAGYKFIEWLVGGPGAKLWALNGGIPSNKAALADPEVVAAVPQFELLAEAMPYRHITPLLTTSNQIVLGMQEAAAAAVVLMNFRRVIRP